MAAPAQTGAVPSHQHPSFNGAVLSLPPAINLGVRSAGRDQANLAAGGTVSPWLQRKSTGPGAGYRTRQPDNIDVLGCMDNSILAGVQSLAGVAASLAPDPADKKRASLESAIASQFEQIRSMEALGMDTTSIKTRVQAMQDKLNEIVNNMFN